MIKEKVNPEDIEAGTPIASTKIVTRCLLFSSNKDISDLSKSISPLFSVSEAKELAITKGIDKEFQKHLQLEMKFETVFNYMVFNNMPMGQRSFMSVDGGKTKYKIERFIDTFYQGSNIILRKVCFY